MTLHRDIKVVDGKLFYEKRWFRRGQAVQVETKNGDKFPAMISAIGEICFHFLVILASQHSIEIFSNFLQHHVVNIAYHYLFKTP